MERTTQRTDIIPWIGHSQKAHSGGKKRSWAHARVWGMEKNWLYIQSKGFWEQGGREIFSYFNSGGVT